MTCENSITKLNGNNGNSYIAVHASICSIFIAVVVAFSIYYKGVLYNLENSVINEAEKINDISFIRSVYYPDEGFEDWAKNINNSLNYERIERSQIQTKEEKNISKLSPPSTPEDIIELFRYLDFLADPFDHPIEEESHYSIGNGKFIPRDSANRGEEILRLMNILGHCYLFPEAPFETDGAFKKEIYYKK